jgi:peptide/nickel transport system substrate-binding protein
VTTAPFNNINARLAFAYAVDRVQENTLRNKNVSPLASGPFGPGVPGYLANPGLPSYDPVKAKQYLAKYTQETGKPLQFTYLSAGTDPEGLKTIDLIKTYVEKIGIKMTVKAVDESQGINNVIGKQFQAVGWRNHPGFDPDTEWVWWHCSPVPANTCDNPVNFNGFNDPVINKALDDARVAADPATRTKLYEDINRQFAKELWNLWGQYVLWTVEYTPNIHGVLGPKLPDGADAFTGLPTGHPVLGLWCDNGKC